MNNFPLTPPDTIIWRSMNEWIQRDVTTSSKYRSHSGAMCWRAKRSVVAFFIYSTAIIWRRETLSLTLALCNGSNPTNNTKLNALVHAPVLGPLPVPSLMYRRTRPSLVIRQIDVHREVSNSLVWSRQYLIALTSLSLYELRWWTIRDGICFSPLCSTSVTSQVALSAF